MKTKRSFFVILLLLIIISISSMSLAFEKDIENAICKASFYNEMSMSDDYMYQLMTERDGFDKETAEIAIDNIAYNGVQNAVDKKVYYQNVRKMSRNETKEQLKKDKFSNYEIKKAFLYNNPITIVILFFLLIGFVAIALIVGPYLLDLLVLKIKNIIKK